MLGIVTWVAVARQEESGMVSVIDVAAFILKKTGEITTWKLQKLVYYSQAWSLVWDEEPLFEEEIQAWANGPVVPVLYDYHKGKFKLGPGDIPGDYKKLSSTQVDTVTEIIQTYGKKSGQWLSDLTHSERPWQDARHGVPPTKRGEEVIELDSLAEYYGSLGPECEWQD